MLEFKSVTEMRANYKAVKQRLNPPAPKMRRVKITEEKPVAQEIPVQASLHQPYRSDIKFNTPLIVVGSTEPMPVFPRARILTIIRLVCHYYRISQIDLLSERRTANLVRPRQIAMYLCKTSTFKSLPEIGRRMGRDHTTVLHAVRKITLLMESDPKIAFQVAELRQMLEGA